MNSKLYFPLKDLHHNCHGLYTCYPEVVVWHLLYQSAYHFSKIPWREWNSNTHTCNIIVAKFQAWNSRARQPMERINIWIGKKKFNHFDFIIVGKLWIMVKIFRIPFTSKYYNLEFLLFQKLHQLNIEVNIGCTISIFKYIHVIYQTIKRRDTTVYVLRSLH